MTLDGPIVYLVDDDPAVLRAVARVLRGAGWSAATFSTPERFLREHDPERPGCAVLDLAMPGLSGLELQTRLARGDGAPRQVIFLTGRADVPDGVRAMKQGAVDFLTKPVDADALVDAVARAVEVDGRVRREWAATCRVDACIETLTPREREVMVHVVTGALNKQIAAALGTSEKTIKVHRARVMRKMGAGSLAELVRLADNAGPPAS